jgi:N-acetylglucosaminyl-diphospho-decaprenol L-rhamnosyltransferase
MSDATEPYVAPDPAEAELAVVIVNYNAGEYLERCLASLATHRGEASVDVLVIDNASRDASHVVALATHPWARLIENRTNVLLSPAWNQGIRETKAPYVLLLNPDAELWRGTLAEYLRVARAHPQAGIVGPQVRNPDGTVYPSGRPFPGVVDAVGHALLGSVAPDNPFTRRYRQEGWDRASDRTVDWVSGCCMLMPRAALEEVHGFDEAFALYGEELDIATRLRDSGWSVLFTPEVEVIHQIGVSTGRSRRMLITHSNSIYRYFRKHRATGWRRVALPFAWALLRLRAEIEWLRGRMAR